MARKHRDKTMDTQENVMMMRGAGDDDEGRW